MHSSLSQGGGGVRRARSPPRSSQSQEGGSLLHSLSPPRPSRSEKSKSRSRSPKDNNRANAPVYGLGALTSQEVEESGGGLDSQGHKKQPQLVRPQVPVKKKRKL